MHGQRGKTDSYTTGCRKKPVQPDIDARWKLRRQLNTTELHAHLTRIGVNQLMRP